MLFSTDTRDLQFPTDGIVAPFSADTPNLHMRDFIDLDQELADELAARGGTDTLVLVADVVRLSGAVIRDRDVTIVARSVEAGVSGMPPLKLARSGPAADGVLTQEGIVHPPVPVLGTPPEKGLPGPTLTVLGKVLSNFTFAESHGQQGGKGLKGPKEIRSICEMNPPACEGLTPFELAQEKGAPGGQGLKGGEGGEGGIISVAVVQDLAGNAPLWRGVGGLGGLGGKGGTGGQGGNALAPRGDCGPDGPSGDVPDPVDATVAPNSYKPITEDEFYDRVKEIRLVPSEDQTVAQLWAEFKRREAASEIRSGFGAGSARHSLDEAARLAPETEASTALRRLLRNHSTALGIENDLDLIGTPDKFESEMVPMRESMDKVATLIPVPGDDEIAYLLSAEQRQKAMNALKEELATRLEKGEFTIHRSESGERLRLARKARRDAHIARSAATQRLDGRLTNAGSSFSAVFPDAGLTLNRDALQALRAALFGLAPALPIDDVENPEPPALPSGDPAILLPTAVGLLVHSSVRDAGPHGEYPPDVPTPPSVFGLAGMTLWPDALKAGTGHAIDLTSVANELRSGYRTSTGTPVTDPTVMAVVNDLVELAEATHLWRLADLRLEQAIEADTLIAPAEEEAKETLDALPDGGNADMSLFIRGLRVLGDLASWRVHRAQRAHDLFTLDLRRFDIDPLSYEQFDPGGVADLSAPARHPQSEADKAARVLTKGLERLAKTSITASVAAYRGRGTEVPDFLADRIFCLQPGADCTVAPHVFEGLNDPLQAGFWLDADLADVKGPHREAKINGVLVRFFYDLDDLDPDAAPPSDLLLVRLVHEGLSRQQQLDADIVHYQRSLPRVVELDLVRQGDTAIWQGAVSAAVSGALRFPALGRGVAAGYRLELGNQLASKPELLRKVEVRIQYDARQAEGTVNLRSVALSSGLRDGVAASGIIELTGVAPAGGTKVRLRSTDPATLKVPAEITVPGGATSATFSVEVLKPTGPIPPTLTASTLDGVSRHAIVSVPKAAKPLKSAVTVDGEGSAFAVALSRPPLASPTGPRSEPTLFVTHSPVNTPDAPAGEGPGNSVHAYRADLTELSSRPIGFWPRSIDVDASRGRLYVVYGPTVVLLDTKTLATKAEHLIGGNATNVAVDTRAELAYVTRYSHGTLHVLRGADLQPVEVFGTLQTLRGCIGMALDPARSLIYVARNFRIAEPTATAVTRIVRRSNGTHAIDRDVTVGPTGLQPQSIALDAKAGLVFVGCLGGGDVHPAMLVLDANTLATLHTVRLPAGAQWVASREGSGIAYVTTSVGLHVLDGRNGRLGITIKAGKHPQAVAVDPVTGVAYVVDRVDHSLTRVETPASVTATAWR